MDKPYEDRQLERDITEMAVYFENLLGSPMNVANAVLPFKTYQDGFALMHLAHRIDLIRAAVSQKTAAEEITAGLDPAIVK